MATMRLIFSFKQFLNYKKVLTYTLVFILSLLFLNVGIIQHAIGAESKDEPHISLKVENKRLGDVLKIITLDTGFKFKLNDQWISYPVNASIENMPLHRGLKLILRGLNHTIIYESNKTIRIMVYGFVDSRKTDSYSTQPISSQIQDDQQEPALSPESSPEETDDLMRADDSSEENSSSESTEDKSTKSENSSDNGKKEGSEDASASTDKELDQDTSSLSENTNEQNEQKNTSEDAMSESSQEQNIVKQSK